MSAIPAILYMVAVVLLAIAVWGVLRTPTKSYWRQKLETGVITLLVLGFVGFLFWAQHFRA